jgi:hypothetical protein
MITAGLITPEALAGDSFFTLNMFERIGLIVLSLAIIVGAAWSVFILGKRVGFFLIPLVALVYWVLISLAPQIYYLYYIAIFDGLPWQWVAQLVPIQRLADLARFQARANLSELCQGFGFWILLASGIVGRLRGA